jgi:spore coat protein U-like protein
MNLLKASFVTFSAMSLGMLCSASAVTKSSPLTVSANVVGGCSIQSASLPVRHDRSAMPQQMGNVAVNCTNGTAYTLALNDGAGRQGSAAGNIASIHLSHIGDGTQQNIPVYSRNPSISQPADQLRGELVDITLSY